jgi:flagellar basal-body rod protein FlgB
MTADVFALAEARLGWIGQRQALLAQNIANADTPGYRARDLTPFAAVLAGQELAPTVTQPNHLSGRGLLASYARTVPRERAPDGNEVNVEDELTKVADGETNAGLVGNLWKTYMGMYMTALGRSG